MRDTSYKLDLRRFSDAGGPKEQKIEFLKATKRVVKGITVLRNRVLVATYMQPSKTKGGVLLADNTIQESRFQGKVGLILKVGPVAFHFPEDDHIRARPKGRWRHKYPKVGDWVFFRASDTWECGLDEGAPCKFIFDDSIVGKINDPDLIW